MPPMKSPSRRTATDDFDDSFSLTHLAQRWGVPRRTIRELLKHGELPFVQVLGQLRVPAPAVREYEQSSSNCIVVQHDA